MKNFNKTLACTAVVFSAICSSAMAENNHSVSIEASFMNFDQSYSDTNLLKSGNSVLPTIGYGYNFEFDKLFVKPSIYLSIGSFEAKDEVVDQNVSAKSTFTPNFSFETDIGYNINSKFGIFGTLGLVSANLERDYQDQIVSQKSDADSIGYLVGVGLKYNIMDQLSLTAKYQISQLAYDVADSSEDLEVDLTNLRVGLSYNF